MIETVTLYTSYYTEQQTNTHDCCCTENGHFVNFWFSNCKILIWIFLLYFLFTLDHTLLTVIIVRLSLPENRIKGKIGH
jgi:hypothetical protein